MNDTLHFFKDRVRYNNPDHMIEGFDEFKELYSLINPVRGYIEELVVETPLNYQVKIRRNENPKLIRAWILDTVKSASVSNSCKNEVIYNSIDERTIGISFRPKK